MSGIQLIELKKLSENKRQQQPYYNSSFITDDYKNPSSFTSDDDKMVKSEVIAIYALCGFSNFGSIGITLGGMTALAPNRKKELSRMVLRSMIAGNVSCFLTACIASLLYNEM